MAEILNKRVQVRVEDTNRPTIEDSISLWDYWSLHYIGYIAPLLPNGKQNVYFPLPDVFSQDVKRVQFKDLNWTWNNTNQIFRATLSDKVNGVNNLSAEGFSLGTSVSQLSDMECIGASSSGTISFKDVGAGTDPTVFIQRHALNKIYYEITTKTYPES